MFFLATYVDMYMIVECVYIMLDMSGTFCVFRLPYTGLFGGIAAMRTSQFIKVNGFSNMFFGWGGEDDDMFNRYPI